MSFLVAGLVLKTKTQLSPARKLILLGIAEHAKPDGTAAWPSVVTLARYAEIDRRSVQRALRALQEGGWITVDTQATNRRPTAYSVNVARLSAVETETLVASTLSSAHTSSSGDSETDSRGGNTPPQAEPGAAPGSPLENPGAALDPSRGGVGDTLGAALGSPEPTPEPVQEPVRRVTPVTRILTAFDLERKRRYREDYAFAKGRDAGSCARLLKKIDADEIVTRIQEYVWSDADKLVTARHPWGMFVAGVNNHGRKLTTTKREVEASTRQANSRQVAADGFFTPPEVER